MKSKLTRIWEVGLQDDDEPQPDQSSRLLAVDQMVNKILDGAKDYHGEVRRIVEILEREQTARMGALIEEVDGIFSAYSDKFHIPTIQWKYIRLKYLKANPTSEVEG